MSLCFEARSSMKRRLKKADPVKNRPELLPVSWPLCFIIHPSLSPSYEWRKTGREGTRLLGCSLRTGVPTKNIISTGGRLSV